MENKDFASFFVDKIYQRVAEFQKALEVYWGKVKLYPQGRNEISEIVVEAKIDQLLEMFYWMKDLLNTLPVKEEEKALRALINESKENFMKEIARRTKSLEEEQFQPTVTE